MAIIFIYSFIVKGIARKKSETVEWKCDAQRDINWTREISWKNNTL